MASRLKPDLIITDINTPRMGGIELIRNSRKVLRLTPILTLTTESQQAKRDEAKKLSAAGWLVKPIGGADLLKVIRQVLPGARDDPHRTGDRRPAGHPQADPHDTGL